MSKNKEIHSIKITDYQNNINDFILKLSKLLKTNNEVVIDFSNLPLSIKRNVLLSKIVARLLSMKFLPNDLMDNISLRYASHNDIRYFYETIKYISKIKK